MVGGGAFTHSFGGSHFKVSWVGCALEWRRFSIMSLSESRLLKWRVSPSLMALISTAIAGLDTSV